MEIISYSNVSEIAPLENAWNRLSKQQPRYVPDFSEFRDGLEASGDKFRILVAADKGEIAGVACFVYATIRKGYGIAERILFHLPIRVVTLFGSCVLGAVEESVVEEFIKRIVAESDFDLMNLGEIIIESPLYNVISRLRGGLIVNRVLREDSIRWLIKLPGSFDEYLKSLGAQTRKKDVGRFRKAEQQAPFDVHVISRADQVEKFLQDGEKVSRLTYQWNLGQRLLNDETNRTRLKRLADKGILRCYLLYVDGQPRAFGYGEVSNGVYLYQASGYDPQYIKESLGTALMLWMIRDVINNSDCKVFDFGMGGNYEYKPRFGNTSVNCAWIQIGRMNRPYSLFLVVLDRALNSVKNLAVAALGRGKLMQRLKRSTRRYGDKS
jgi:Acetyltransferase (GNAT) domain